MSRALISSLFDTSKLSNPCSLDAPSASSGPQDCGNSEVLPYARLAKLEVSALQTDLGECGGMNLDPELRVPVITASMSDDVKMKEIYKSLVRHAAYMEAMTVLRQRHSSSSLPPVNEYQKCVTALKNLQCSVSCRANMPSADLTSLVDEVGAIQINTQEDNSERRLFDCLVVNSTMQLLDMITSQVQG